jgi:hypothetical protein
MGTRNGFWIFTKNGLSYIFYLFCCPTGHGKIETMGALSISTLLLVTGGGIAWTAIDILQA